MGKEGKGMEGQITYTNEDLIARYLYLRGKKERARKFWQAIEKGRNEAMEVIAQTLMERMKDQGEQNIKTSAGTAYRATSWSVTTSDKAVFVREIVTQICHALAEGGFISERYLEEAVLRDDGPTTFPIDYLLDSNALRLLDARPVKETALAYLDEHKVPPPGINIEGFYEVHVRKG